MSSGSEIHIIEVGEETYGDLPNNKEVNDMANVKLLIPEILPTDDYVLYLDADTIINDRINELLSNDLNDRVLAASPAVINRSAGKGIPLSARYVNAGVMLINQREWIDKNISKRCLEYIEKYEPRLTEQTALNAVLHTNSLVDVISPEYNITRRWYEESDPRTGSMMQDPGKIIHYPGPSKPWHFHTKGKLKNIWLSYYNKSPFSEYYPQHKRNKIVDYSEQFLQPFPKIKSFLGSIYRFLN